MFGGRGVRDGGTKINKPSRSLEYERRAIQSDTKRKLFFLSECINK